MARFLPSWYNFNYVDECRGTMLLNEQKSVPLQELNKMHWRSVAMQAGPKVGTVTLPGLSLGVMRASGYNDLKDLSCQPTVKMVKD